MEEVLVPSLLNVSLARRMIGRLACLTLFIAGGCGGSARMGVEGAVTLDGKPVNNGQITFVPMPGTSGPTAGASIIEGRYSVSSTKGPLVGSYRVEITTPDGSPKKVSALNAATGETEVIETFEPLLPARYNRSSELTAEVTADGPNQFDFELKSK